MSDKKYYNYKITCLVNGKIYIGKCTSPKARWNGHKAMASKPEDKKRFQLIHRAIRKHGVDNFTFEVIGMYDTEEKAFEAEIRNIKKYNSRKVGYNLTDGGEGASGLHLSDETKAQMSKNRKGRYKGKKNPFYGKTHTEESRKIISQKALERDLGGERNPFYGKTHSQKIKNKIMRTKKKKGQLGLSTGLYKKVNDNIISEIRTKYQDGNYTMRELATQYNIHESTISNIIYCRMAYSKLRDNKTPIPKIKNRISVAIADKIRKEYNFDMKSQRYLCKKYNIGYRTINALINFKSTYKNDAQTYPNIRDKKKISTEDRNRIIKQYSTNKYTQKELASKYNTCISIINKILNNRY